jgi:protein translocase SecG subunit
MNTIYTTLIYFHVFVSVFLVFLILVQKTTGNGLFTTSQSNSFMSGAEITSFVSKLTAIFVVLFFANTLALAKISYVENSAKRSIVSSVKEAKSFDSIPTN